MRNEKTGEIKSYLEKALENSTCLKHPVAAVIYDFCGDYVESGWNGPPDFIEHKKCLKEGYSHKGEMKLCPGSHAETMAISKVAEYAEGIHGGTIYLSKGFLCIMCANSIINAKIKTLVTPDEIYSNKKERTLVSKLRNQPESFEMVEKLIVEAGIEIIVDKSIKLIYKKNE